jgi:hypothetical protein
MNEDFGCRRRQLTAGRNRREDRIVEKENDKCQNPNPK